MGTLYFPPFYTDGRFVTPFLFPLKNQALLTGSHVLLEEQVLPFKIWLACRQESKWKRQEFHSLKVFPFTSISDDVYQSERYHFCYIIQSILDKENTWWCLWWCLIVLSFFPRGVLDDFELNWVSFWGFSYLHLISKATFYIKKYNLGISCFSFHFNSLFLKL